MIANKKFDKITVRVQRQNERNSAPYWEEYEIQWRPSLNVIAILQDLATQPVTKSGSKVKPVVWDCSCLEEVCGACTMIINGKARQACSTVVDTLLKDSTEALIVIEPMSKFPVVRDLFVNRERMFNNLKRLKAWVPMDGTADLGPGPREGQELQDERYAISRCMTCGCCLEACPQFTKDNSFIGAQAIAQAHYFNSHPTGAHHKAERLDLLMKPGGIADCGNSQNCATICPKEVPLTEAIAKAGRATTIHAVKSFFSRK